MIYEIRWVAYVCAGSMKILGLTIPFVTAPPAAHPAMAVIGLCRAEARIERFDPARLERARGRAHELGAGAELRVCRGVQCSDNLAQWITELTFKEK